MMKLILMNFSKDSYLDEQTLTISPKIYKILGIFIVASIPLFSLFWNLYSDSKEPKQILGASEEDLTTPSSFREEKEVSQKTIPFTTKTIQDDTLELETKVVRQTGSDGLSEVVTTKTYYNDAPYDTSTKTNIITPPVDEIIAEGTKVVLHTMDTPYGTITYTKKLENFKATSYDKTCKGCTDTTATGMKQGYGVVAVDPKVIPLYTRVYVPGYGIGIAGDVGGGVKGNMIDLGFDSINGQWSTRYVDVYILAPGT